MTLLPTRSRTPVLASPASRVGAAGAAVVGVAFGMARYALGLTLPDVRTDLGMSDALLGVVASGTFAGYLAGLLLAMPLAAWRGPRAPTTLGGLCAVVGCLAVAFTSSPLVLAGGAVLAGTAAGWVWAPYSDIVTRVAPPERRPLLLAVVNTGTSAGFWMIGMLALLATVTSWRVIWAGTAAAAALAALLNLRLVPPLDPGPARRGFDRRALRRRALVLPLAYAVAYAAGCTVFFTYASQAIDDGGLPASARAVLFVAVATTGVAAVWSGRMVAVVGSGHLAALCLAAQGVALALLATSHGSFPATVVSSLVYGIGYMVGGAVLAIWTAEAAPQAPGDAFTAALVLGAVSAIAAPALIGALTATVGLAALLLVAGVAMGLTALAISVLVRRTARA
jgi:predicted MFS family arabinose efflux permease